MSKHLLYNIHNMADVADKIKKYRGHKGISQEQLAREIGVSLNTVHRWESGKTLPSPLAMSKLQEILNDISRSKKSGFL
jgi:putative transcriptional regulator